MDPWLLLRRDLQAVLASLGLRMRELRRRNGEGDLPLPALWPRGLAPLFWPLVLALAMVLLLVAPLLLGRAVVPAPPAADLPLEPPLPIRQRSEPQPEPQPEPPAEPPAGLPAEPGREPSPVPGPPRHPAPDPAPAAPPEPQPQDSLLQALQETGGGDWIRTLQPSPARGHLRLQLEPGFTGLERREQQRLADLWLRRSRDLGYETLSLEVVPDGLVGRSARVGSGMILLQPTPSP